MNRPSTLSALLGLCIASLTLASAAQAATVRVKCEVRGDRSVASVDGRSLAAGNYTAVLSSGSNTATAAPMAAKAGEAEFDFSSRPRDIAAGATAISADFIVGGQVTGSVINAAGQTVATASRNCRVR